MKKGQLLLASVFAFLLGVTQLANANGGTGWDHGYFWSLYYSSGSASISFPGAGSYAGNFAISWSGCGDMVGGKGWNPGSYRTIGYNAGALNNINMFGVYGWTTSPLVEYYIVEVGYAANGSYIGSVSSDGHSYSVYHHQQVNQPSIIGTATFWQNIDQWGGSGTGSNHSVTTGNHFNYWNSHGMNLGSFNYQILAAEEWNGGSGYVNATCW
jgi:endo-1,4-beta-xylanase